MKIDETGNPGRNESKQYVYSLIYQSALRPLEAKIKLEIGLRFNPIMPVETRHVQHAFLHPFTGEPLFDGGKIKCLTLNELIAEKLRASAIREKIVPRDFYDLDFILRNGFDLTNKEVENLFKKKLEVIVVGTGLAGAGAASALGELGYNVKNFCLGMNL